MFDDDKMEEERRTCYVAITRAQTRLYMSCVLSRNFFGKSQTQKPSQFLREIPEDYVEHYQEVKIDNGRSKWVPYQVTNADKIEIPKAGPSYREKFQPYARFAANQKNSSYQSPTAHRQAKVTKPSEPKIKPDLNANYKVGDNVKHGKWGVGVVTEVDGTNITIDFSNPEIGTKNLNLKYAPIEKY